jgi:hypothetical protein
LRRRRTVIARPRRIAFGSEAGDPRNALLGSIKPRALLLLEGCARSVSAVNNEEWEPFVMLYLGPEVVAPVLSALAAVGGVLLMFWRRVVAGTKAVMRLVTGRPAAKESHSEPDTTN